MWLRTGERDGELQFLLRMISVNHDGVNTTILWTATRATFTELFSLLYPGCGRIGYEPILLGNHN